MGDARGDAQQPAGSGLFTSIATADYDFTLDNLINSSTVISEFLSLLTSLETEQVHDEVAFSYERDGLDRIQ